MQHEASIDGIFRSPQTKHGLNLFRPEDIEWLEAQLFEKNERPYLKCLASDRDRPAKPEEIVRQLWIKRLLDDFHYPKERIRPEWAVWFGSGVAEKAADIVIMHTDGEHSYIIFEVKKPKRKDGLQQLKSYCNAEGSPIGVWSNGGELVILHREEPNIFTQISSIPTVGQTLQDVITEPWTIEKLTAENKLVRERLSLKKVILDLEDLVLANAGVDAFEEVFKLLYAKLYDEWAAIALPERQGQLQFRIYGESPDDLKRKISGLFNQARSKWPDVFAGGDRIELSPSHLVTCVSFLQDIRLFNANLQIIDEAFEYLMTQVAKGAKGQYFTPRWVIDMSVKMLNPKAHEYVVDPAAGSCGFLVHAIMWIAKGQITANGLPIHAREFAQDNVYAIDFDGKAIKIAKAMNLIAGDGKSNVYKANSLDPKHWDATVRAPFRRFLLDENDEDFQNLRFDVLFTNPPFAGQVRERDILRQYRLAERNGRTVSQIGRDILFVERCLHFLRPGGRMAIVLPQGRLNNAKDLPIRQFVLDKARVLAVVGLHSNTFKPHTGTKTSVLFLQKYTEEQLAHTLEVRSRHAAEWDAHLTELRNLAEGPDLTEDDLPSLLLTYLQAEFEEPEAVGDGENENEATEGSVTEESDEEVAERIGELEAQLADMPGRAKGKAELRRTMAAARRKLAARSLLGQLNWILDDEQLLARCRDLWLAEKAAEELEYSIFFAVSEKGGKDSSGDPIFKRDANGELMVDEYGHLIVDHDLDEIAGHFVEFATEQKLDFWVQA